MLTRVASRGPAAVPLGIVPQFTQSASRACLAVIAVNATATTLATMDIAARGPELACKHTTLRLLRRPQISQFLPQPLPPRLVTKNILAILATI